MPGDTTKRTLEIEARTKDLATKGLQDVGKAGEDAGKRVGRGMRQADDAAKNAKRSILELGEGAKKAAAVAGSAFASVGAAASLANANMDSLASAGASAAGSIAAGFAAGGPVGGALAIASAGIGALIFAFRQSGEAARESAKVAAEAYSKVAEGARAAAKAASELREAAEFRRNLAARAAGGEDVDEAKETRRLEIRKALNVARQDEIALVEKGNALLREAARLAADDDDERAVAARQEAAKVLDDVNGARQRRNDLLAAWRAMNEEAELRKVVEARKAEAEALKKAREEAEKALEARKNLILAIGRELEVRRFALDHDQEEVRLRSELIRAGELRIQGEAGLADALENVARSEYQATQAARARAEALKAGEEAARQAASIDSLERRGRAAGVKDPVQALLLRQEEELARFAGTRLEREALIRAQKAEQVALSRDLADQAKKEADEKRRGIEDYVQGLEDGNALLRAEIEGTREALEIRNRLAEAAKKGGREAVEAVSEQIRLERELLAQEKQRTAEKEKQAAKESEIARLAGGGTMDKGLASRRNRRRARLHLAKRERELSSRRSIVAASGPFGIVSEESEEGLGTPSVWGEGSVDQETRAARDSNRRRRDARTGAGADQAGLDAATQEALRAIPTVTGEGNKTAEQILEQAKAQVEAQKKRNETDAKIAEAAEGTKAALEKAVEEGTRIESALTKTNEASGQVVGALERQASALGTFETTLRTMRNQVDRNTTAIQRLADAAALKGGS